METQSIEHNKSTTIQSRKPPMGVWLTLKGFGIRQQNRIVRHIFSHFSVEIDNMSNFRLWTECVLMQFPRKLLFLVHLWIYTQHELITTGSLAYILVTARRKKRKLSSLSSYQKGTVMPVLLAWCLALELMWHRESYSVKPGYRVSWWLVRLDLWDLC